MLNANITVENQGPRNLQCRAIGEGHKTLAEKTIAVNNVGTLSLETQERQGQIRLSGQSGGEVRITNTGDRGMKVKSPDDLAIDKTLDAQETHSVKFECAEGKDYILQITTQ